jgi:chromosome segregation ATPase
MKRLGLTHEKRPEPATISAEGMSNAADPLDHTLKQISLEAQRDMKKAKDSVDDFEELFEWLRNFIDIDENSQQKLKCDMKRVHTRLDIDTRRLIQLAEINVGLRRVEQQKTADLESLTNQLLALKEKVTVNEAATSQKYVELQSCKKLLNTARTALQQKENELEQLQKQIKKGTMHPMAQSKQEEAIRLESEKALERTKKGKSLYRCVDASKPAEGLHKLDQADAEGVIYDMY